MPQYILEISFVILGGILTWIIVFLATYPHFPRMEKSKRLRHSITSATIMAVLLMLILFITLYILDNLIL